jgi:hypothetical protein
MIIGLRKITIRQLRGYEPGAKQSHYLGIASRLPLPALLLVITADY